MLNRRNFCRNITAGTATLLFQRDAFAQSKPNTAYIYFEMSVNDRTMRALQSGLMTVIKEGCSTAYVLLNSSGGSVSSAIAMYHWMVGLPIKVNTYALSDVSSAAIILFLAGKERVANSGSRFGFHSARHGFGPSNLTPAEIKEASDDLAEDNQRLIDIYVQAMNLDQSQANALLGSQIRIVRSKEAIKIGLATMEDEIHMQISDRLMYISLPN